MENLSSGLDQKEFSLDSIGQIAMPVTNIEKAITFYRDDLGLKFLFRAPPGLAFFDCGGVRLMLDEPAKNNAGNGSIIYFNVSDIQNAHTLLSEKGVDFVKEPHLIAKMSDHEIWMTFFYDQDKNLLALMCEVPL